MWSFSKRLSGGITSALHGSEKENHRDMQTNVVISKAIGDNPIKREEDDSLGRTSSARVFADQVSRLDFSEGVVVGILGPWGSGKTSFINLARPEWERAEIRAVDFNPWMFSGAEQLVESFFIELAAQLKIHPDLAETGRNLEEYGEMFAGMGWLPIVGPWIERVKATSDLIATLLKRRREGVSGKRKKLTEALEKLEKPVIVVIDDVDRLSTSEIRDIFKLIRVTVNFPNIIYVVAFDRARVETALEDQGLPGRDYLEKILQVAIDLPAIPDEVLNAQIFSTIDKSLVGISNAGHFDQKI
ncbi:MAG TPA: P-loop NTPase fold protein, partial [Allocoleopsis sp.]